MRITFLGVGAAFSRQWGNASLLVEAGETKLVIDCGPKVPAALERAGVALPALSRIVITHLHADHIGGLEEVALMSRIFHRVSPVLSSTTPLIERLWSASLRGGLEFIELTPGDTSPQALSDFFTPAPVTAMAWVDVGDGLRFRLRPTYHVRGLESYAVEVEERPGGPTRRVLFSGDTRFDPALIDYGVEQCAKVLHDCSLVDIGPGNRLGVHTSYAQLLTLPEASRRKLLLYHYGDEARPDAVADGFEGFATDLMQFEI